MLCSIEQRKSLFIQFLPLFGFESSNEISCLIKLAVSPLKPVDRFKGGHGWSSLLNIFCSWTVVVQSRGLANCQFLFIIFTLSFPLLPLLACPCCSLSLSLHLFFSICVSSLIAHYCLVSLSLCFPPYLLPV